MKQYQFHIEPLPAETMDATIKRFDALGADGWHAVGKYSTNHMLFEREYYPGQKANKPAIHEQTGRTP
jgi:hypothetical protein